MKHGNGVYVILTCPAVLTLRRLIEVEEFPDQPMDRFMEERISNIIEEMIIATIENCDTRDNMYQVFVEEILDYLSHYLWVIGIQSISCWYDDTLLIHCSPIGVKHVNGS